VSLWPEGSTVLQEQYEEWASLGFLRSCASASQAAKKALASQSWLELLFKISEGDNLDASTNLPTQIQVTCYVL